jgi:hypothetical protein
MLDSTPVSQITNVLATGNTTRWQGYDARLGFGMTRIKNQTKATIPRMITATLFHGFKPFLDDFLINRTKFVFILDIPIVIILLCVNPQI